MPDRSLETPYRTSDLYFAAYLAVAGVSLLGTQKTGGRVYFLFEDQGSVAMKQLKDQYFMDRAKVNALSYSQAIKKMKALLYADSSS
jgi:hypothetical protein